MNGDRGANPGSIWNGGQNPENIISLNSQVQLNRIKLPYLNELINKLVTIIELRQINITEACEFSFLPNTLKKT